jgi:hypothetical protein
MSRDAAYEWSVVDLAYHQLRVLLLVNAVSSTPGHSRKLDGLTKLAKLDFLVRYPALATRVLDDVDPVDTRLHIGPDDIANPTEVDDPMVRYKFGPWDDRYYPVIGALVSRGLVRYATGGRGSVALRPTPEGQRVAREVAQSDIWAEVADRCEAVAHYSAGLSGSALKKRVYARLADLMDRPHREVIR